MKNTHFFAVAFSICAGSLFAQSNLQPSAQVAEAMGKIQFLAGNWKGSGWIQMGPQRHTFKQTETVAWHANGTVLTIDGLGRDAADSTKIIHQAFALISYDQAAGQYLLRAVRADGNHVDADFSVQPDGSIVWGFVHPMAGRVRYTIRNAAGKWVESGEMSRDGQTWTPFLAMQLERVE